MKEGMRDIYDVEKKFEKESLVDGVKIEYEMIVM